MKNLNPIILTLIIGSIAGVLFILIQPVFGMSTLTSRHAEQYFKIGQYSATTAVVLAWFIHLAVSMIYALTVLIVFHISRKLLLVSFAVVLLGWVTTVIAPVANFMVINAVSKDIKVNNDEWPPFNFSLDEKFILHVLFFLFIAVAMYFLNKPKNQQQLEFN